MVTFCLLLPQVAHPQTTPSGIFRTKLARADRAEASPASLLGPSGQSSIMWIRWCSTDSHLVCIAASFLIPEQITTGGEEVEVRLVIVVLLCSSPSVGYSYYEALDLKCQTSYRAYWGDSMVKNASTTFVRDLPHSRIARDRPASPKNAHHWTKPRAYRQTKTLERA